MLALWRGMKSSKQLVLRLFSIVVLYMAGMFAYQIWYTRLPTEVDTDSRDQLAQVQLVNSWTFKHLRELQESRVKVPNTTEKVEVEDCNCGLERMPDMKSSLLYGRMKPKGYLTIGIPSIARPENKTYIKQTIDSLINNANSTERNMTTLVIFLGDLEVKKKEIVAEYVMKLYYKEIQSGFIQIIHAPRDWYPSLEKLKVTYNHEMKQIKWRTKQNFDFAYMMLYSRTLSEYYLQLEDDVTTVPGYFEKIVSYIRKQETPWTCLEFSELGFIAKLFHSADLEKLSKLLLLFYNEQPNDVTYLYFNELMTQFQRRIRQPTIFQHHGLFSTLAGKYQRLKDKSFNTGKIFHGDNPPARIYTSLTVHEKHRPRKAYDRSDDFFWAKSPKKGDTFTIVFKKKQSFKRILIDSGSMQHPADIIDYGILQASPSIREQRPDYIECEDYVTLGQFEDGRIDVQITEELVPFEIACLEIKLILQQSSWIVIREIAVFLQVPQNLDELWALSRKFDQGNSRHKTKEHGGDNPAASIYSTFTGYHHHTPEMAYNTTTGFFWVEQPKLGDTYTIALHKPKSLVKIIVETGNSEHPSDRIEDGIVFVSYNVTERRPEGNVCGFYLPVGNFTDGRAAITLDYKKYPGEIACVQIKLTSDQENWILIREIALFLRSFYF